VSGAGASPRVRVIVADDHPLYREGVVRALSNSGRVEVVAEVEDGAAALAAIREHRPEVALLDYRLPELDGVAVAKAVADEGGSTRVLVLSAHVESGLVRRALENGAAGYLPKEARREQIVDATLACARGEAVLPTEPAGGLAAGVRPWASETSPGLSGRETEILRSIAAGRSLPEIATELSLGVTTVKTHVQHLYRKLGVSDRAAAVAEAMRRGLID
jgi:two-component system nitrate/nitrite response regulator NarL